MESLNLNNLASSLPPPNLAKAEKDLTDNFKGASPVRRHPAMLTDRAT